MTAASSCFRAFVLISCGILSGIGTSAAHAAKIEVKDALRIELGIDFFEALSSEVRKKELSQSERVRMDDVEDESGGAKVRASGISYIINVRSFQVAPRGNTLNVDFSIGDVNLHVDELQVRYKLLRTTCRNINVNIATGSQVAGAIALLPAVADDRLQLTNESIQFVIPESEYHAERPESCSGGLLSGVIKNAIERQLTKMRPKLEEQVRKQLAELAPKIQNKLNDRLLETAKPPGHSRPGSIGEVKLSGIGISANTLFLELGAKVEVSDAVASDIPPEGPTPNLNLDPTRFAWVGLNTRLINLKLAEAFPRQFDYQEIRLEDKPELQGLFTRENLAPYLEDLQTLQLDNENLKAAYRMDSPPSVEVTEQGEILVHVPRIDLKLQVLERGEWKDYFSFLIDVAPKVDYRQLEDRVEFGVAGLDNVQIDGRWQDGYPRRSSRTNLAQLSQEVSALLQFAAEEKGTFSFRAPEFKFEDRVLKPELRPRRPYLGLEVIGTR